MRAIPFPLALVLALAGGMHVHAARPNIVFIFMDDLRHDELGCTGHPFVKTPHIDRLAREGALFRNAFATTPLCSPSRACFLTGLYAHAHGIVDNTDRSPASHALVTWPRLLHDKGYKTAFIGKWHMGVDDSPRPGFDHWISVKGQGRYFDPELNVNGQQVKQTGYVTDLFNAHAVEFLKQPQDRPFCLFLAHKCVHPDLEQRADGSVNDPNAARFTPAERHAQWYAGQKPPRRPNAFVMPRDKPALMRSIAGLPPLSPQTATDDATILDRLRLMAAAEEGVGQILSTLEQTGRLDQTVVIFTSDHGYFYGEHCLNFERRLAYEETIRIPLVIRYPPLIKPGVQFEQCVLSLDIGPTLLELGEAALPDRLHGRSLVPLLTGQSWEPRTSFLIEHSSDNVFARMRNMGYQAVRTDRWKYIRYRELQDSDELYDLAADPYELKNLATDPNHQQTISSLAGEMDRLLRETK
jgi:N-acetylglucosamine-6-sulfatase